MKRLYEPLAYDTNVPVGSWWEASVEKPSGFAPADKDISTEVAIIGAGYTGLNAALQLAEQHATEVAVLEAGQPGWGASGRNGGFCCLGGAGMSTRQQIKRFGLSQTKTHMACQMRAINLVADNLARYDIDADTHSEGEVCLAHHPKTLTPLVTEAEFERANFGIEFEQITKSSLRERGLNGHGFHGGVHKKAGFALNPLKYAQGLTRVAANAGVKIYGNSPVTRISRGAAGFELHTPAATIRAKKLIVATNGYSSDDIPASLAGSFLPVLSTILVTRPISPQEQAAQGWSSDLMSYDSRNLLHYFRLMPDGRFLFGQRGALRATPKAITAAKRANRRDFERMFPAWRGVEATHYWSGLICLTRNMHQFTGPLPGLPGAFAALGYHGNGVAMGSLCGRLVGDLVAGGTPDIPAVMSTPLRSFLLPSLRRLALGGAILAARLLEGRP